MTTTPHPLPPLDRLPSVLAIPLQEYTDETHPVMRLHRLCDAVEVLTRFCTITLLGELRTAQPGQPLPEALLAELQPHIERPTFGQWRNMLHTLASHLWGKSVVVPEMLEFVETHLLPGLRQALSGTGPAEQNIVDLRNILVHGGSKPRVWAEEQLTYWDPWLTELLSHLGFLEQVALCFVQSGGVRQLAGVSGGEQERPLSADLQGSLVAVQEHVVLLGAGIPLIPDPSPTRGEGKKGWLDL